MSTKDADCFIEVEGFFNLVYYLLCKATETKNSEFLPLASRIVDVTVNDSAGDRTQLKYRLFVCSL